MYKMLIAGVVALSACSVPSTIPLPSDTAAYCTEKTGKRLGKRGLRFANVCTGEARDAFIGGYRAGRLLYDEVKKE